MKIPKIRKLPSGAYTCQLRLDGRSISITDPNRDNVIAKAMSYKTGLEAARRGDGNITLNAAIDLYIDARKNTLSPSTIRGYRSIQRNRFSSIMDKKISSLTQQVCQRACNEEARQVTPKTLSNCWHFIQSVIKEQTGTEVHTRLPQKIKKERPFLSPEEISVFVSAVKGTDFEIPALLALSSLRSSEILALTYKSVDLKQKRVKVSGALVKNENGELVRKKENKTMSSARNVPLFIPELVEALEREVPRHAPSDVIVTMSHHMLFRRINKVCRENNLPEVGVHGLRHSFASLAYALDIPELVAMQIGGWSDFGTMRRIYTHIAESQKMRDVDKLQAFFDKKD